MDVKIIANIGYWAGQAGKGPIAAALTPGGTYLAAIKMLVAGVDQWTYLRLSQIRSGLNLGDMKIADNFKIELLTDQESPEFASGEGTLKAITTVTNGDSFPRLMTLEEPYSIKGEGVVTSDIDKLKTTSIGGVGANPTPDPNTPATGNGILDGLIPSDFGTLFSNPVKFMQDNVKFIILVAGLVYFFRRKKKKPLWLF